MTFTVTLGGVVAWTTIIVIVVFVLAVIRMHTQQESYGGFRTMMVSGLLIIILALFLSILILRHLAG